MDTDTYKSGMNNTRSVESCILLCSYCLVEIKDAEEIILLPGRTITDFIEKNSRVSSMPDIIEGAHLCSSCSLIKLKRIRNRHILERMIYIGLLFWFIQSIKHGITDSVSLVSCILHFFLMLSGLIGIGYSILRNQSILILNRIIRRYDRKKDDGYLSI